MDTKRRIFNITQDILSRNPVVKAIEIEKILIDKGYKPSENYVSICLGKKFKFSRELKGYIRLKEHTEDCNSSV